MAMRYGSFCPIAKAAEAITGRWTPLILYELMRGSERFSEIQHGVPLMPRSLLARRLREMELDGLLIRIRRQGRPGHLYRLTPAGDALRPLIDQLGQWGTHWRVPHIDAEDRNVSHLMWSMRALFGGPTPDGRRLVVHFEFRNLPRRDHKLRQWWMILRDGAIELCITDMGFDADVEVKADLVAFFRVLHGHASLQQAQRSGDLEFAGERAALAYFMERLNLSDPPVPRFIPVSAPLAVAPVRTTIRAA